ncbi:MAG: hypothetical protein R3E89_15505 [Thiolinea sp.]
MVANCRPFPTWRRASASSPPGLTNTRHIYTPVLWLSSKRVWDKLGDEGQQQLTDSIEPSADINAAVVEAIKFFETKHAEEGGSVTELSDEQRQAWKERYTPEMQQQLIDSRRW